MYKELCGMVGFEYTVDEDAEEKLASLSRRLTGDISSRQLDSLLSFGLEEPGSLSAIEESSEPNPDTTLHSLRLFMFPSLCASKPDAEKEVELLCHWLQEEDESRPGYMLPSKNLPKDHIPRLTPYC